MLKEGLLVNTIEAPEQAMARVVEAAKREIAQAQQMTAKLEAEKRTWEHERKRLIREVQKVREQFGELMEIARKLSQEHLVS